MWVIDKISALNTEQNDKLFSPTLHMTDNKGNTVLVLLDFTCSEVRDITIRQLEEMAVDALADREFQKSRSESR
jgi:hypothetical protein